MPHGYCFLWDPRMVWLHAISDGLITFSYYLIPLALVYLVRRRRDLPFGRMFAMFGLFVMGCGTTHLMEIWNIWHASHLTAGIIKAASAAVSLMTAISLVPLVPQAIKLPSPAQLKQMNCELREQAEGRQRAIVRLTKTLEAQEKTMAELDDHRCSIEELELARAALAESRGRLDAIIHSAMDAIVTMDASQRIVLFNAAAEKMFGYSSEKAIGQSIDILLPERFRQTHRDHVRRFGESGITNRTMGSNQALRARRSNGQEFQIEPRSQRPSPEGRSCLRSSCATSEPGNGSTFTFTLPVYSLAKLLEPVVIYENRLLPSFVLVRVDLTPKSNPPLGNWKETWQQCLEILRRCAYLDKDVVLPPMGTSGVSETFFVPKDLSIARFGRVVVSMRQPLLLCANKRGIV
jgi:PAS domain S-box-containing protein